MVVVPNSVGELEPVDELEPRKELKNAELEQAERLRRAALDCYLNTIGNIAHYAIELDGGITAQYREYVNALVIEAAAGTPEALRETGANLRGLLRDYRDQASAYLNQLRTELVDTANSLQRILDAVSQAEGDPATPLQWAVRAAGELPRGEAADAISPGLGAITETIEQNLAEIAKEQQLTVWQFLVEIRLLHKRIDALESAVSIDALTKLFTRTEMEFRIRSAKADASLLLLSVEGFRQAESHFSSDVAQDLAGAFIKRLRNSTLPNAVIGRWAEEEFLVILPGPPKEAADSAHWIREHLAGPYACLQNGKTVRPTVRVNSMVVELTASDTETTLQRVSQFLKG